MESRVLPPPHPFTPSPPHLPNLTRRGFALLLSLLLLAVGAKAILYDTLDPDLFWHLRVADQLTAQPYSRPIIDNLSFASIKTPWTPYSWLADLAMKQIWDVGSYRAVILIQSLLCMTLVLLIALNALELSIACRGEPRYLSVILAAFVGAFLSMPYLSFRPVTFALVLIGLAAWLIQRDRRLNENSRAVWLIIPITALLTNIHLYVIFLPAALFGLLIDAYLLSPPSVRRGRVRVGVSPQDPHPSPPPDYRGRGSVIRYAILFATTTLACLLTPMLPGAIQTAWHYQFTDVMVAGHVIAEMQPFYRGQFGVIAAAMVLITIIAAILNRRILPAHQWLFLFGSVIALSRMGRFAPIFAIFAAPTLAVTLPRLSEAILSRRSTQYAVAALILATLIRLAIAFPSPTTPLSAWLNRHATDGGGYPTSAADYVLKSVPTRTHHLISEFTWGGYLEWRLNYPWQVLMDGRTQLYSADFWKSVYLGSPTDRKTYLATLSADAAVVPAKGSTFRQDLLDLGWTIAWTDPLAQVLVPPAQNAITDSR